MQKSNSLEMFSLPAPTKLFGYLPVNKPKGICINRLLTGIVNDAYYVLDKQNVHHGTILISYARYLDRFANGLVTFIFGACNIQKRNFMFADYKYRLTLELGVERSLGSIDGQVVASENVDHVSSETLREAAISFVGNHLQKFSTLYRLPTYHKDRDSLESVEDYYNQIIVPFEKPKDRQPLAQKYPIVRPYREVFCSEIQLLEYNKPFATFEVSCQGRYSVRQFTRDFLDHLEIKGSLIELMRTNECIADVRDLRVFSLHETNLEYYLPRLHVWRNAYDRALARDNDMFTTQKSLRLI